MKIISNRQKSYFIFLMLVLTLILGLTNTPVIADSVISLDDGWEDEIIGNHNGTSGYFDYEINFADMKLTWWQIDNTHFLDTRSFYVKKDYDATTSIIGWWNLTYSFDYIPSFEFRFYLDHIGSAGWLYFYFFNATDNVLKIRFDIGGEDIDYYDVVTGWSELSASWTSYDDQFAKITFTHVDTNIMNYSIFNSAGTLMDSVEDATAFSGTWTSFTGIAIGHSGGGASDELYMWFDNFNITSSGTGQEEGEGAEGSEYVRCSYNNEGTLDLSGPYIEGYINSFGDVTINAVDLFVSTGQYNYVGSNKSKYVGYLNGVSIGNPDYFFQDSSTEYVLRWQFSGINIATYDISLEFSQVDLAYSPSEIHWLNLPINSGNILGSTYHNTISKFGDGSVYGIPFSTINPDIGFKYCLYYDFNDVEGQNTYDIDLWSNDPHAQANYIEWFIDVTGTNDYYIIAMPPSESTANIMKWLHQDGEDTYLKFNLPPDAEIGEWFLWCIDKDLYTFPTDGLTAYGFNHSFNVSSGIGTWDEWEIVPAFYQVLLGEYNGIYVKAPDQEGYAVRIIDANNEIWKDASGKDVFTGLGGGNDWDFSGLVIDCYAEGIWFMELYNASGLTYQDILTSGYLGVHEKSSSFSVTSSYGTTMKILSPSPLCIPTSFRFMGYYSGASSEILIIHEQGESWSIGVTGGTFNKPFIAELEGDYTATLGSISIDFYTNDCDIPPIPPDPTIDPLGMIAGLPVFYRIIIGVIIVFFLIISPWAVISHLDIKQDVEIPPVIYAVLGGLGLAVSTIIGCWGWEVPFLIYSLVAGTLFIKFWNDRRG